MLGGRDLEALHPPGERLRVVGLHQQVNMRALDAEVDDAEVLAQRRGQGRLADRLVDAAAAQVADRADHPEHHMDRVPLVVNRPGLVRRARPLALGGPPRPPPLAAALLPQRQLLAPATPAPFTRPRLP
jgi:hypothetical protein